MLSPRASDQESAGPGPRPPREWGAVVPAKPIASAKSRLASLGDEVRRDLVVAFLHDTVSALLQARSVRVVVVCTDDVTLARTAMQVGAWAIPDGHGRDLNAALVEGAAEVARRAPGVGVVVTVADLPAVRAEHVEGWLAVPAPSDSAFVADTAGTGTTVLRARQHRSLRPAFGPCSRAAHRSAGADDLTAHAAAALRRDVDEPQDLAAARELGLGERSRWVLTRHRL